MRFTRQFWEETYGGRRVQQLRERAEASELARIYVTDRLRQLEVWAREQGAEVPPWNFGKSQFFAALDKLAKVDAEIEADVDAECDDYVEASRQGIRLNPRS